MKKMTYILSMAVLSILSVLAVVPAQGMEQTGKWGVGLHGLGYKLLFTDHSDIWTVGGGINLGLKYGLTNKFAIGLEGQMMQTYLANRSDSGNAGITFDNVKNGPRQRAFIAGLVAEYHFTPEKKWSPYVFGGPGIYIWRWADKDWNTLTSADPSLVVPGNETGVPPTDKDTNCYYLRDQELYAMVGAGIEFFPTEWMSLELGAKFRFLSHFLTNFEEGRDIVGKNDNQLDLPQGLAEVYVGASLYFGGKKECPPLTCAASGNPTSGPPSLTVQFSGSADGGCPGYSYSWDFGDGGSSSDKNPKYTYQTAGNYTAKLTVTDSKGNSCEERVSSIMVGCPPLTCTASANPTSGTAPLTVRFSASASGGCPPYTYSWDIGEGGSSSQQNPSHLIEKEGKYTARVTVTDSKGNSCQKNVSYETYAEFIPTPEKPLVLHGVKFEFDKSRLTIKADSLLDLVATSLKRRPDVKVSVVGHCDWVGSEAYNQKLSILRAEAVRDYLIRNGVKADNLTFTGYGETKPMATNQTAEWRALNRRVELHRIQ